jgi:hypothetical protein
VYTRHDVCLTLVGHCQYGYDLYGGSMAETIQEYVARLLSLAGDAEPIAALETTPARLRDLIAGHTPDDLRWTPAPGRWSIVQILSHLADAEIVFAYRVRMMLSAPATPIQAYDQDAWVSAQHAERSDPQAALDLFTAVRASMVRLLQGLTDVELDRFGLHAERGRESIRDLMRLVTGHDRNHLAQVERLIHERDPTAG